MKLINESEQQELEVIAAIPESFFVSITPCGERYGVGMSLNKNQAEELVNHISYVLENFEELKNATIADILKRCS